MQLRVVALLALLAGLPACQRSAAPAAAPEAGETGETHVRLTFDPTDFDPAVRPQDDFYRFVNGRWIAATQIPADLSSYGILEELHERTEAKLRDIVEPKGAAPDPAYRKLRDLYASFMDEERAERAGLAGLAAELSRIDSLGSHAAVMEYLGQAIAEGVDGPVAAEIIPSAADPAKNLLYLLQSGLGLPDRDYYVLEGERFATDVRNRRMARCRGGRANRDAAGNRPRGEAMEPGTEPRSGAHR
jgi:predicted metalloendopeptidase